jgi:hypothetical protein
MRHLLAGLTLALALYSPCGAEPAATVQVFIRNVPFPAQLSPEGAALVQFEPFARKLGYELHARGDILEILAPGDNPCPAAHPAGLYFQHEPIPADTAAGTAPLEALATRLGARVVNNSASGTIDVYPCKPRSKYSAVAEAPFQALCFTDGDPAPSQLTRVGASLQARFGLQITPVDVHGPRYETFRRFRQTGALPLTVLLDGAGRILGQWTGIPNVPELTRLCEQRLAQRQLGRRRRRRRGLTVGTCPAVAGPEPDAGRGACVAKAATSSRSAWRVPAGWR